MRAFERPDNFVLGLYETFMNIARDPVPVAGAAGFIGYHMARRLLEQRRRVVALDNLNVYYDPALKPARLEQLAPFAGFRFEQCDLADRARTAARFSAHRFPWCALRPKRALAVRSSIRRPTPIRIWST